MQCMELIEDAGELERRVGVLMRVKALSGPLEPARECHFWDGLARIRSAMASGRPEARDALAALDLLSLELCDD